MKITLLTDGIYPFVMGGMQKHSYYLAKYLAQNEIDVVLYHCVPKSVPLVKALEGFTTDEEKHITHHCFHFPSLGSVPGHYIKENKKLSKEYLEHYSSNKTTDKEVIYAQGFVGNAFIEAKNQGVNLPEIVVNFHGLEMFQKAPSLRVKAEHLLLRKAVKYNVRNADQAVSLGGKLTEILKKIGAKKININQIGIEKSWLAEPIKNHSLPVKFVFIGRYERRKGIEELNEVLQKIAVTESFEFHFIGPIPEDKKLSTDSTNKKTTIIYHGQISEENEIKRILQQSDILVSPSWSEGMPTVILEAMASGCAIIASDVGAVSEEVDASNGWLIEAGNKKQLEKTLFEAIHTDPITLNQMKMQSIAKIKNQFLWSNVIRLTIDKLF